MTMNRREFLATGSALATTVLAAPALAQAKPKVVVVGGGPGGVTAAKYIAKDSQGVMLSQAEAISQHRQ